MYYGWVEDKIWSLAQSGWHVFHELPWCLVTCIGMNYITTTKEIAESITERQRES
jgi:hypothetical protein